MSSHSPTPSSGHGRTARKAASRSGGLACMSERQTAAYLLARDAVRRIQRTSSLLGALLQRPSGSGAWAEGDPHQSH